MNAPRAARVIGSIHPVVSARLDIRPFRPADADALYAYLSLPEIYRFEPGEPVDPAAARLLAHERSQGSDFLALELRSESRVIGHLSWFAAGPARLRTWELGFIVHPRYQCRGFASEGARAWLEHAFTHLGVHRVVARCHPQNIASWRALERIGFIREGRLRSDVYFRCDSLGRPLWQDTLVYGLVEPNEG